jgi:membrane-bound serine protease (ClpP class)
MNILIEPNIAYLLLASGSLLAILALLSPGSGILEIGALFTLILAGWITSFLPINLWALIVLVVGVVPFLIAVRKSGRLIFLAVSCAALILGSTFLFRNDVWYIPAVNPLLALVVSILSASFMWLATRKVLETANLRPTHDLEVLIGATGQAKTDILEAGSVQVDGELWSAQSDTPIPNGAHVRVTGREGFILKVEPDSNRAQ